MNRRYIEDKLAKLLMKLRASNEKISKAQNAASRRKPLVTKASFVSRAKSVVKSIKALGGQFTKSTKKLLDAQNKKKEDYRQFKADNGLPRDARTPDLLNTYFVLMGFLCGETLLVAGIFISDGKFDVVLGLTYAATMSAVTILLGMFTGYLPGRFLAHKIGARLYTNRDIAIRLTAWAGFLIGIASFLLLLFSSARVRALGTHKGIFDFAEVSLYDTFNDYLAIAVAIVAGVAGMAAIMKGMTGIKDIKPGFTEALRAATDDIRKAAEDAYYRALDHVDDLYENAVAEIEDSLAEIEDYAEDRLEALAEDHERITAHNHEVEAGRELIERLIEEERQQRECVTLKPAQPMDIDWSAFDRLMIAPPEEAQNPDSSTTNDDDQVAAALAALGQAHLQAVAEIENDYAAFLAEIVSPLDEQENEKWYAEIIEHPAAGPAGAVADPNGANSPH